MSAAAAAAAAGDVDDDDDSCFVVNVYNVYGTVYSSSLNIEHNLKNSTFSESAHLIYLQY